MPTTGEIDHLRLLRAFLAGRPSELERRLAERPPVGEDFHDFLERNALRPFFWPLLQKSELIDRFPGRFVARIRDAHAFCAGKNERLLRQTADVQGLFDAAKIEALVPKGPLLATHFYGDIGQRSSGDVDFLLRDPNDIERADEMFRREGFERRSIAVLGGRIFRAFTYESEYRRDDIHLDLHWALRQHFALNLDYAGLWKRRDTLNLYGRDVYSPSDPDLLWCSILTTFTDVQHGKVKLRAFIDLWLMVRRLRDQDWNAFLAARQQEGLFEITHGVMDMLFALLGSREEFSALSRALEAAATPIQKLDEESALALLNGSDTSYRNRLWGFELYDAPLWKSVGWALLSAPMKALVYWRLPQALQKRRRRKTST
jgi:hypothetical protein